MGLRRPKGWGIVDLAARLAILTALLYSWRADDNDLAFVLTVIIAVWSITALIWMLARRRRTS